MVRKIRNTYAHVLVQIDFSHELILSDLSKLIKRNTLLKLDAKRFFINTALGLHIDILERSAYLDRRNRTVLGGLGGLAGNQLMPIYQLAKMPSSSEKD